MESERKFRWIEAWGPVIIAIVGLSYPVLVWAGGITARIEQLERDSIAKRMELREDLREINHKLDALMEQRNK